MGAVSTVSRPLCQDLSGVGAAPAGLLGSRRTAVLGGHAAGC